MEELKELLEQILNENIRQIVLSDPVCREIASKAKIRPVLIKGQLMFQETLYKGTQVFHTNYTVSGMKQRIPELMCRKPAGTLREEGLPGFGQAQMNAADLDASVLVSKKGTVTVKKKKHAPEAAKEIKDQRTDTKATELSHNRAKKYILQEGIPVDFLVGLGVQSPDGKVTKAKYDKFRQINRYLEFIEDVLEVLPKDRTLRIIDFGCGKSYLTFAMYYYLHVLERRDIQVTGLDLKEDVIDHCNALAEKCGYDRLRFEKGDISTYEGADSVDMVVSLHACDTATDYALEKAVKWGAKVILAVPCCQHEVNRQIKCDMLKPVLQYGLIKERMSALITDAVRASLLTEYGYDTQILEFIDMEHTPKNLLIRAVRKNSMHPVRKTEVETLLKDLNINPTLLRLLRNENEEVDY